MKIKDTEKIDKFREEMMYVENLVKKIPDELLPYVITAADKEMQRRSKRMELSHRNKLKYKATK